MSMRKYLTTNRKSSTPYHKYLVTIEGDFGCEEIETFALSEKKALGNACARLAEITSEPVAIVRWKVNTEQYSYDIEELEV